MRATDRVLKEYLTWSVSCTPRQPGKMLEFMLLGVHVKLFLFFRAKALTKIITFFVGKNAT